jgi:hypothetical protein
MERVTNLIDWLRACEQAADYDEFQRHLFQDVHEMEECRSKCTHRYGG